MIQKGKFNSILKFLYFTYALFIINNICNSAQIGLLGENNIISNLLLKMNFLNLNGYSATFFIIPCSFIFYGIWSDDELQKNRGNSKQSILNKELLIYKILIAITTIISLYIIVYSHDKNLIITSGFLILISVLIYYVNEAHIIFSLNSRQAQWLKSINSDEESSNKYNEDTIKWRLKIWYDNIIEIDMDDRYRYALNKLPIILIQVIFVLSGMGILKIFIGCFLVINILSVIEDLFGLYTSISGVCTSSTVRQSRSFYFYNIVVTDYKNKREISFELSEDYNISEMDNVEVVHGILTKRYVYVNNIINRQSSKEISPIYIILFIFIVLALSGDIKVNGLDEFEIYSNGNYKSFNDYKYKKDHYQYGEDSILNRTNDGKLYKSSKDILNQDE